MAKKSLKKQNETLSVSIGLISKTENQDVVHWNNIHLMLFGNRFV